MHRDEKEILKLIAKEPNNSEYHQKLGKYYIREKDYGSAKKALYRSLELDCGDAWSYMYLGNICHAQKRTGEALDFFQHAAQLIPDASTPFWCIAEMYKVLEKHEEANAFYKKAAENNPNDEDSVRKFNEWKEWYAKHKETKP